MINQASLCENSYSLDVWDVSNNKIMLKKAGELVSTVYARYLNNQFSCDEVSQDLCHKSDSTIKTLVAAFSNHETYETSIIATCQIHFAQSYNISEKKYPFEFMELMCKKNGWGVLFDQGFIPEKSVEVKRLAVSVKQLPANVNKQQIIKEAMTRLILKTIEIVKSTGRDQYWAIMAKHVIRTIASIGFPYITIDDVSLNSQKYHSFYNKYASYWLRQEPKLYRFFPSFDEYQKVVSKGSENNNRFQQEEIKAGLLCGH